MCVSARCAFGERLGALCAYLKAAGRSLFRCERPPFVGRVSGVAVLDHEDGQSALRVCEIWAHWAA